MSNNVQIGVAILAGGQSTRMGTNKALLRSHPGAPTIIEQVLARLRGAGAEPDLIVTNTPHEYGFLGIPMRPDDLPGAGPMGGILTALQHSPHDHTFVVACDMPLLSPDLLRHMLSLPPEYDVLVPRWSDEGHIYVETLHAIYSRRCIEPIRRRVEAGKLKITDLLQDVSVRYIEEDELRRHDPHLDSFRNVNTPGEWERLAAQGG